MPRALSSWHIYAIDALSRQWAISSMYISLSGHVNWHWFVCLAFFTLIIALYLQKHDLQALGYMMQWQIGHVAKLSYLDSFLYNSANKLILTQWPVTLLLNKIFLWHLRSNSSHFPFLLCFSLLFISQLFVKRPQTTILPFCITFHWVLSWSLSPVQCHEPLSIVHQALCLSDLIP